MPKGPVSAEVIADDAAALLRALDIASAHVAGFSMGGVIAQEPALRHSELVRSLVLQSTYALFRSQLNFWRWLPESSPSEHAFFEAFFTWVYTPRAHADGSVDQIIQEAMAFPYKQSLEGFQAQVDACLTHDTADRLSEITSPTLVLSAEFDIRLPPRLGRSVAAAIPNARFEVMPARRTSPSGGTRGMGRARRCILAGGWSTALKSATQQTNAEGAADISFIFEDVGELNCRVDEALTEGLCNGLGASSLPRAPDSRKPTPTPPLGLVHLRRLYSHRKSVEQTGYAVLTRRSFPRRWRQALLLGGGSRANRNRPPSPSDHPNTALRNFVERSGLEPPTPCLQSVRLPTLC